MSKLERFSDRKYAAPFGRFEASTEAESPADEILIGREGQRAYFIDILLRAGRRGAFLVTGHRGVGKSSFVYYCLKEYENEVFDRFLRSNVGRTLFWDRALVLLLLFAAPLFLLMLSQLMELLTLAALKGGSEGNPSPPNLLVWVVIVPLLIICVYPLLYGWETLSVLFKTRLLFLDPDRRVSKRRWVLWLQRMWNLVLIRGVRPKQRASILSFLCTVVSLVLIWTLRPFGAPALSLSRLFCALCGVYLWARCSSFQPPRSLTEQERETILPELRDQFDQSERRWHLWHRLVSSPAVFALVAVLPFVMGVVPLGWLPPLSNHEFFKHQVEASTSFRGNLAIGFILLGAGAVMQSLHLARRNESAMRKIRVSGSLTYLFAGVIVAAIALLILGSSDPFTFLFSMSVVALAGVTFWVIRAIYSQWWRQRARLFPAFEPAGISDPLFRPRPHLALAFKAAISLVVGLHLIYPVAKPLVSMLARPPLPIETWCNRVGSLDRLVEAKHCFERLGPDIVGRLRLQAK